MLKKDQSHTPDRYSVVAKHNSLIPKISKFELSELRLISFCIGHLDSRGENSRVFKAKVSDLTDIFPMDKKSAYAVIKKTFLAIGQKPLELEEDGKRFLWNWFSGFIYEEGVGEFEFRISPDILPYLQKLDQGNFTRFRLESVYQFSAASTWKMYEVLKQRLNQHRGHKFELDELRLLLGVAGKYPRWSDFAMRIISPSLAEINKLSDIRATYLPIKRARLITGLHFFITEPPLGGEDVLEIESTRESLFRALVSYRINPKVAEKYAGMADQEGKVEIILRKLPVMAKAAAAKSAPLSKYITGAIKNELTQGSLFDAQTSAHQPDYQESLDCWNEKRRTKEKCKVRERGAPGQRKKCQICLIKLPPEEFGF